MDFPFMAAISYLTPKQKEAFEQFLQEEPEFETIYRNKSGDARQVLKIVYPSGCVTKDSVFVTIKDVVRYHTPSAVSTSGMAEVFWCTEDKKKHGKCTSEEWFEWLGTDYTTTETKPTALPEEVLRDRKIQLAKASMLMRRQAAEKEIARTTYPKEKSAPKTH